MVQPLNSNSDTNRQVGSGPETVTVTIAEDSLHVMPGDYLSSHSKVRKSAGSSGPNNRKFFLLIGGLCLILGVVIVGLLFYLRSQTPPAPAPTTNQPIGETPVTPTATTTVTTLTTPEARDLQRIRDINLIQQALAFYLNEQNIYPQVVSGIPQKYLPLEPRDPLSGQQYLYASTEAGQSYTLQFVLEGQSIFSGQVLKAGLHTVGPKGLINEPAVNQPPTNTPPPITPPPASVAENQDTDNDGLTTAEEKSFRTDKDNPDTDSDGYKDGQEVVNLFSPITGGGAYLNNSGLVHSYSNVDYNYSTWLPQDWFQRSVDATNRDAVFTSPDGDTIQVSAEPNDQKIDIDQWYLARNPGVKKETLKHIKVAGLAAIKSNDGLTVYLTDGQFIFTITYEPAGNGVINYPAVFNLVLQTFKIPGDKP